ncbi:helix-turn-helix domain-containing protein [Streptomyces sp. NPDC058335]|uniref:helix-turn-helix domain-containing protein n=1 Tax=Streptomyces sp. NPDC058335 TaxID=3346451 RepID=UPI0036510B9C
MSSDPPDDGWLQERQRIGRSIKAARIHRNLTQEAVFLAIPMNRSYYQEIEAGAANPTLDTLLDISKAIGVQLAELLDERPPLNGG